MLGVVYGHDHDHGAMTEGAFIFKFKPRPSTSASDDPRTSYRMSWSITEVLWLVATATPADPTRIGELDQEHPSSAGGNAAPLSSEKSPQLAQPCRPCRCPCPQPAISSLLSAPLGAPTTHAHVHQAFPALGPFLGRCGVQDRTPRSLPDEGLCCARHCPRPTLQLQPRGTSVLPGVEPYAAVVPP